MSFVHTRFTPATDDALLELNDVLSKRVFIVNNHFSLADLCLYAALSDAVVRAIYCQQSITVLNAACHSCNLANCCAMLYLSALLHTAFLCPVNANPH